MREEFSPLSQREILPPIKDIPLEDLSHLELTNEHHKATREYIQAAKQVDNSIDFIPHKEVQAQAHQKYREISQSIMQDTNTLAN